MKTIINSLAGILIVVGIMAMAGSANDCDGACMETANTLGEMLVVAGVGRNDTVWWHDPISKRTRECVRY